MSIKVDVIIIGAGVIGLSIGYNLSKKNIKTIILESENNIGRVNSSRNTEVIHAGIYYKINSLKGQLCKKGKYELYDFCLKYDVKCKKTGKIFLAKNIEEINRLNEIYDIAYKNGLKLKEISKNKLNLIEPNIIGLQGLLSTTSGIIDSHDLIQKLNSLYIEKEGVIAFNTPFLDAKEKNNTWQVIVGDKDKTIIETKLIINCAGLKALDISKKIFFNLKNINNNYVKGAYIRYSDKKIINHIIYPAFKPGIIEERVDATPDLYGDIRFGPSIEKTNSSNDFDVPFNLITRFKPIIKSYIKNIDENKLKLDQAGIRPRISIGNDKNPDFYINWQNNHAWLDLLGIESPGLTASLAIGKYVLEKIEDKKIL